MKYQDTYKDFESLFKEAVEMGIIAIDIPEDPPTGKKPGYKYNEEAIYGLTMDFHFLNFRDGLIESGKWDGENKKEYTEQLTIENLVQCLKREEVKYIEQLSTNEYIINLKREREKKGETERLQKIENEIIASPNSRRTDSEKLIWKGQKNQLYSTLRQLKNDYEFVANSYNSLAEFLIQNVSGFENTSKETIEKELKKNTPLPKQKRVEITPGESG
ncbi:MAG: hypothetical protein ABI863_00505 [Ginsengibacter sp.]